MVSIKPEKLKEKYGTKKRSRNQESIQKFIIIVMCFLFLISFLVWKFYPGKNSVNLISVVSDSFLSLQAQDFSDKFWETALGKLDLGNFYELNNSSNDFINAEAKFIGAKILGKKFSVSLIQSFERALQKERINERKMLIMENIAFLKASTGIGTEDFERASQMAADSGLDFKANLYSKVFRNEEINFLVEKKEINRELMAFSKKPEKLVLGLSKIIVTEKDIIGSQVDRVNRDWYGKVFEKFPLEVPKKNELISYHEGARIKDILDGVNAKLKVLSGTIAYNDGEKWYAPDENGIFRFEVLPDKIQYPSSKIFNNLALIEDTHGISSLVFQAVNENATLVIGCGDSPSKMQAAVHLAELGINVYFPCDRYVGEVIGYKGKGILIGTAPVKKVNSEIIIGNQPIKIGLDEIIIVQDINHPYPAQYYDAPKRYFKELEKISGMELNLKIVEIDDIKETYRVVKEAESKKAKVIAVRVAYEEDYEAVKRWLEKSNENRAVLFHSAPYDSGYRLFKEFPKQTSFGDPKPVFE